MKITRPIPGNVCVQAEAIRYAEAYKSFSVDPASRRKNPRRKNKIVIPNYLTARRKLH